MTDLASISDDNFLQGLVASAFGRVFNRADYVHSLEDCAKDNLARQRKM